MKIIFYCCIALLAMQATAQSSTVIGDDVFGDIQARHIGPAKMSGRVTDIEGHPTNNKVIWIGTAGGGVWKSENGGVRFNPVFEKYCQSIGAVTLDPLNPNLEAWVGTGEVWTRNSTSIGDGIYKTNDGGQNWIKMGLEKSERISSIKINPKNNKEILVGVLGGLWSNSTDRGVYKTNDGGKTWEKIFYVNETTGCSDLAMDPTDPNILYASFWEFRRTAYSFNSGGLNSALYKSTDGGKTWNKIHNGFPAGKLGRIAIAIAPSNPKILYSVIECEKDEQKGLYRSDDAGQTWSHKNADFGLVVRPFYFSRIVVDPKNPEVVAKAGLTGSISRDGGKTFRSLGSMHSDIHDVLFNIENSDQIIAGDDGGIWRSWDAGNTFEHVKALPLAQYYYVAIDKAKPYNVYGGLQDNGSWFGPSESLGGITNADWTRVGGGDGFRVMPHPTKKIIYSEMQGAENVWRYDMEKQYVKVIKPRAEQNDPKLRFNWNAALAVSQTKPDRLYVGSQFLHRSEDMGETWTKISPDLTTNDKAKQQQENSGGLSMDNSGAENHCTIFTVAESSLDEQVIWVGTDDGQVQVTTNGGKNWTNVTMNLPTMPNKIWVYHVEPSNFDKNVCFIVLDGHTQGDMNTYVLKTTDMGKTWQRFNTNNVKGFARHIKQDLVNPDLLFLGTEMGLYISINGGTDWLAFQNNMPAVPVHYMAMDKNTNDLVLATHGRGIIIIDNVAPFRNLTTETVAKDFAILASKPAMFQDRNNFGKDADAGEFVGDNPERSAQLVYYLKNRHTFGKMTIDIVDANGKVINTLLPGKKKGINIVAWDGTMKAPKQAKSKTFAGSSFSGPRVLPGTYKVIINKGKEQYTGDITYQIDPNSAFSLADKKENQKLTMELFNAIEDLAYLVYDLDAQIDYINSNAQKLLPKDKNISKTLADLDVLKNKLVITKGDNYVGTAEKQLKEKLGELYNNVAGFFGKPSNVEMESAKTLAQKLSELKAEYQKLKATSIMKSIEQLTKAGATPMTTLKTFEEFLKD